MTKLPEFASTGLDKQRQPCIIVYLVIGIFRFGGFDLRIG